MRFIAIDLETANPRMRSICQVGYVLFEGGEEIDSGVRLVDPDEEFHAVNVGIHGIRLEDVAGAEKFPAVHKWLNPLLAGEIAISHSHFDRVALGQACTHHGADPFACHWIDTVRVARRSWPHLSKGGFGLKRLAEHFGITFKHHDALEDARAAAHVFHRAITETGHSPEDWLTQIRKPINHRSGTLNSSVNPEGALAQDVIVFTGAMSLKRSRASEMANEAGARVGTSVTKETTILVVGNQDIWRLAGHEISEKHRRAETLIKLGQPIRIWAESDFIAFIEAVR